MMRSILATIRQHLIRILINTIFLTASCFFSANFLIVLFQNAMVGWIVVAFAVFIEVYFQYSLYVAEKNQKESNGWDKKYWSAIGLKVLYFVLYVCVYAHLSGLGFFLTEVQATTEALHRQRIVEESNVNRIVQIDQEIEVLNLHLTTESETGFGRRSESIARRLDELKTERESLLKTFKGTSETNAETVKNSFESLAEKLGVKENFLQLVVFETILLIIYIGLYVTRWRPEEGRGGTKGNHADASSTKVKGIKKVRNKSFQESSRGKEVFLKTFSETSPESSSKSSLGSSLESSSQQENIKQFKNEMERFIDVSIRDTGNLNSPRRVGMLTGIPVERCKEYRKRLKELRINGEPVVETTQGGSRVNFEKEIILEKVKEAMRL